MTSGNLLCERVSSICHKRDRGFNQSLWETLYQKGCKSMKMWCFCAWVIIDPMKHVEKKRRERGCDVVKNRLLRRMNAKCLSKHKTLKWDFRSNATICMFAFLLHRKTLLCNVVYATYQECHHQKRGYYQRRKIYMTWI